jgi:hypothetical protein
MSVKNADLADLIATTLNDLPKQQFEVAWTNQKYIACRIYQNDRMVIDGGNQIERKIMLSNTGAAHYRRMYEVDNPQIGQVMSTIKVPWTQLSTDYSWDKFEILRNKNSAKGFVNLMKTKRIDGLWSLADLIEERFWKTPTNVSDDLYPYGVPYYLRMLDADAVTAGFNAKTIRYQDGTTGTVCAGIDANTEAMWRNYAGVYSAVDNALLKSIRLAIMYTQFELPPLIADPSNTVARAKGIYTDFDTAAQLMDLADAKDDRHTGGEVLGNIKTKDGGVTVNGLPVVYVPQLNGVTDIVTSDVTAPIYCIDFSQFVPYVHDGYWMEESEPMFDRGQHTTFTVFVDGAHNNLLLNSRKVGFVMHKAITS